MYALWTWPIYWNFWFLLLLRDGTGSAEWENATRAINLKFASAGIQGDEGETSSESSHPGTAKKEIEFEVLPLNNSTHPEQSRRPRKFFQKIHSGAAFLTGLKLGSVLSKKGFELGHGKIVSTHSFQIFGKTVNSATSLSYGNSAQLLPILDDSPSSPTGEGNAALKKAPYDNKEIVHVTVIENPSDETLERIEAIVSNATESDQRKAEESELDKTENYIVKLQREIREKKEQDFLKEHNKHVKEFNTVNFSRRSKILNPDKRKSGYDKHFK